MSSDVFPTPSPEASPSPVGAREAAISQEPSRLRRFLKILGPGLITGASDDDPSGIGTYAVAGAQLGYASLWMALLTFPLMTAVQFICSKIGLVSGRGLAGVLREHYPRKLLYPVVLGLVVANTINAGVDLGAIAAGLNLLLPQVPIAAFIVPVTLLIIGLQFYGSYRLIVRIFKWLTLALFAYIGSAILARPDPAAVLRGTFLPAVQFDRRFLAILVAVLGTTISPYLFFWQTNQEVEEKRALGLRGPQRQGTSDGEVRFAAWDVITGMLLSTVVMYSILLATAATLHQVKQYDVESAAQAAEALRPLAGDGAFLLLTLGLVGSGFLAVPVLTTSGASAVCEACGWKQGLNRKPWKARAFYTLITLSTLAGMAINFVGVNPIQALFWTAVLNGFLAPPLLVVVMLVSNNPQVMGERRNGPLLRTLGWTATILMLGAAVGLVVIG